MRLLSGGGGTGPRRRGGDAVNNLQRVPYLGLTTIPLEAERLALWHYRHSVKSRPGGLMDQGEEER